MVDHDMVGTLGWDGCNNKFSTYLLVCIDQFILSFSNSNWSKFLFESAIGPRPLLRITQDL